MHSDGSSLLGTGFSQLIDRNYSCNTLPFCGKKVIHHFVCEILALVKLACADISLNELTVMLGNVIFLFSPLRLICIPYIFILCTVIRINSAEGRKQLFYLLSPYNSGGCILWDNPLHVFEAKVQRLCFWQTHCPILWSSHTHAQPHHLQPEEYRSKWSYEKTGD